MFLKAYKGEILIFYLFILISCYTAKSTRYRPRGQIQVTVDNVLQKITVNGNALNLSGLPSLNYWKRVKTIMNLYLKSGDVIAITGSNSGPYSLNNPAGILATITYRNKFGFMKQFSTGNGWRCDGRSARLEGANGQTTSIWYKNNSGSIPNISSSAQWIWFRQLNRPQTTCFSRLP